MRADIIKPVARLTKRDKNALKAIARGRKCGDQAARKLERLGLIQNDIFDGKPRLTPDGKEHLDKPS